MNFWNKPLLLSCKNFTIKGVSMSAYSSYVRSKNKMEKSKVRLHVKKIAKTVSTENRESQVKIKMVEKMFLRAHFHRTRERRTLNANDVVSYTNKINKKLSHTIKYHGIRLTNTIVSYTLYTIKQNIYHIKKIASYTKPITVPTFAIQMAMCRLDRATHRSHKGSRSTLPAMYTKYAVYRTLSHDEVLPLTRCISHYWLSSRMRRLNVENQCTQSTARNDKFLSTRCYFLLTMSIFKYSSYRRTNFYQIKFFTHENG